jgi:hypothetical protein
MSLKRTPLRRISDKRAVELRIYSTKRKAYLAKNAICECCYVRPAQDIHHRAKRTGGNYLNEETWMGVCRHCHEWIHNHATIARAQGYLI